MTTTEEVPMPGITIAIREDGIPRSLQGGFYTADQLRAYADARIAALQAELDQCRQLERAAMEGIRRADEFAAAMGNSMREAGCTIEGFEIKNVRAEKAEAERDALAEKVKAMEDNDRRYRWLRNCTADEEQKIMYPESRELRIGPDLDAAIDAAGGDQC